MQNPSAFRYGVCGIVLGVLLFVGLFLLSDVAVGAETIPTRDARLGEQNRSIPGYEAISYKFLDVTPSTISVNALLYELDPPPEHMDEIVDAAKSDMTDAEFIAEVLKMIEAEKVGEE